MVAAIIREANKAACEAWRGRRPEAREDRARVITPGLFDERGLAEIGHPDAPSERLNACINPIMAEDSVRPREELLVLTEKALQKVADACIRKRDPPQGAATMGLKAGAALGRFQMGKGFSIRVGEKGPIGTRTTRPPLRQARAFEWIGVSAGSCWP